MRQLRSNSGRRAESRGDVTYCERLHRDAMKRVEQVDSDDLARVVRALEIERHPFGR
jgi:tRNA A37 N6-isopentenylltransferase MiaA